MDLAERRRGSARGTGPGGGKGHRRRGSTARGAVGALALICSVWLNGCGDGGTGSPRDDGLACGTPAALSGCLAPRQSEAHYVEQSEKYFLTMDSSVSPFVIPDYSPLVARWEWPPWLLLTGLGRANLIWTDLLLKLNPTTYAAMDCRAFPVQPFGRCRVVFDYSGELCPIYEEFTFNDRGEMTFIEAWTDLPGWLPVDDPDDPWAEGEGVRRLSSRLPGLGNEEGLIDLYAPWMEEAARRDPDVADFLRRARDPYASWLKELLEHWRDVQEGCHPSH